MQIEENQSTSSINAYSESANHESRCSYFPATAEGSRPRSPFVPQQVADPPIHLSRSFPFHTDIFTDSSETAPGAEHAPEVSMKQPQIQLRGPTNIQPCKICFCLNYPSQKINEVFLPADHS